MILSGSELTKLFTANHSFGPVYGLVYMGKIRLSRHKMQGMKFVGEFAADVDVVFLKERVIAALGDSR